MKDKEKQRELIVEIMKADEESGLYDEPARRQTAVQFLGTKLMYLNMNSKEIKDFLEWYEKAKEMEEAQIALAYSAGTLDGVTQNFTNGYSYYEKTYKKK